ncbi:hypothetical protein NMG60_11029195 [Bertholletia excelsa]
MDSSGTAAGSSQFYQHIIVMRHGDRIDNFDPKWTSTAAKPWDPPLVHHGKVRAFCTGRSLRSNLGFPIHRAFVSPFLRCIQTAAEVVSALCAVDDVVDPSNTTSDIVKIDPSKLKVSIEYGLCEMLNTEAIRPDVAPKNGNFNFNISELEAVLPAGTVDHSVERVYQNLPKWEETVMGARDRYQKIVKTLADKYPSENLLLVSHGEGVGSAVTAVLKDTLVYDVEYCGYLHLTRSISLNADKSFTASDFEVLNGKDLNGIKYCLSNTAL